MNQREKIISGVTLAVVAVGLGLNFMPEDFDLSVTSSPSGSLDSAFEAFELNIDTLKRADEINAGFAAIDDRMRDRLGRLDHEKTFQNELESMLKNQLNVPTPKISKTRSVDIDDVDDYYFVELDFSADGTREAMTQLLIDLESRGLLVMSTRLARKRNDVCELNVTVARLFKHDADSLLLRERRMRRG